MGIRKIGLLMEDGPYEEALIKGLAGVGNGMSFSRVIDSESLDSYDAILVEGSPKGATDINNSIILASRLDQYDISNMTLFKFQGSKSLYKDLLFLFSKEKMANFSVKEKGNPEVIGMYSLGGGKGVTSVCLALSHVLPGDVLYLNAEPFNSAIDYLDYQQDSRLLMYAVSQGIHMDLSRYIKEEDGFSYFDVGEVNHFSVLNMDRLKGLISHINSQKDYQYIVIDLGRLNRKLEAFEREIEVVEYPEEGEGKIINKCPIEISSFGWVLHLDSQIRKGYYSIFTADVKRIMENELRLTTKDQR
ncbi:MAG: hypothetical protein MJ146_01110 [Clostridia bacterium]|nr:hypothetical protein [Clostridia bacterium]